MSEKREKQNRRLAREIYNKSLYFWYSDKPSKWRFFRYRKWKKQKPVYEKIEKIIKRGA